MDTANEEKAIPQKHSREQIDLLDFIPELGEMSPISDFKGPRAPSKRQVLRHFLILFCPLLSLSERQDLK